MSAVPPRARPLAVASLSSSVLAYASSFVGSATLIWPALALALAAVVCGHLARRAARREGVSRATRPDAIRSIATAGLASGYAFLALGALIVWLTRGAGSA